MWRELKITLSLALPIMLGNIGQVLIGVIDTLMIGRLGVTPLGASAFAGNLFLVPFIVVVGFLIVVPILVSQAKGANDVTQVKRLFSHSFVVSMLATFVAFTALAVNYHFLDRYGQDAAVVEQAKVYYILISISILPVGLYQILKGFSEGLGRAAPPMVILLGGICLNVLLNWILIFGQFGIPAMGLVGAGWATLISRVAMAVGLVAYVLKGGFYRRFLPSNWFLCNRKSNLLEIAKMGVPSAFQHLFEVGAFAGAGVIIGWVNAESLAAHQIALSCASLAFMVPLGVSVATGIRVGEFWGGKNLSSVVTVCQGAFFFTFFQTCLFAGCLIVGGKWMASLYVQDPYVVQLAASILVVVGIFQIVDGCQIVCVGALRGLGDVVVYMFVGFFAYWVVALPLGYWWAFSRGLGAVGVWIGLAIGLGIASFLLSWRLVLLCRRMKMTA